MEEDLKTGQSSISKDVTDLVDTYIALAKANVTEKTANAASFSVSGIIIAVFACFLLLFIGLGLAWWIGQILSSVVAGFFIVAALYGLVMILLISFKEQLLYRMIRNFIVKKIYE